MRRPPLRFTLPGLGVCVAGGLLVAAFGTGSAPAAPKRAASVKPAASRKVTVITVTAGKPSELAFKLSKTSSIPAGTITFNVTDMGVAFHNFKICSVPVTTAASAKNTCNGKATKILHHGDTATLTVTLSKTGKYEFLCTVTGHAAAGMKGLIGVGVKVAAAEEKTAASAGGGASSGGGGSTTPATTTPATTTPTSTRPSSGGGGTGDTSGCSPGVTIRTSGNTDADGDELGTEPDDQDGCV